MDQRVPARFSANEIVTIDRAIGCEQRPFLFYWELFEQRQVQRRSSGKSEDNLGAGCQPVVKSDCQHLDASQSNTEYATRKFRRNGAAEYRNTSLKLAFLGCLAAHIARKDHILPARTTRFRRFPGRNFAIDGLRSIGIPDDIINDVYSPRSEVSRRSPNVFMLIFS